MSKLETNRLGILHIIIAVRETSAPYNEHCLPWAHDRNISICTYFKSEVSVPESITLYEGDGSLPGFFRALRSSLGRQQYHIIHVHSPHLGLLFLLATQFKHHNIRSSAVVTVHDSYQNFKFRNQLMLLPVFAGFQSVVCCGRASYDSFPKIYKWFAGNRLTFVQNGVDIERVDTIVSQQILSAHKINDLTIVAISRLVDIKNPFIVVKAFQQSLNGNDNNIGLIYIGEGPLRDDLEETRQSLGLGNRLELTGLIPRDKVFEYLFNADLFISPSKGEGLPIAVLEAMACRRPVILSDIPPHREIAKGVDFIPLIPPDDVAGFASEIEKFSKMSISQRSEIGDKCRKLVEDRFSLPSMHAGYTAIYTQLCGRSMPNLAIAD